MHQESRHHCATILPSLNAGRIFNSSFSLQLFKLADNSIILIDDCHLKACSSPWGTLQRLTRKAWNFSRPQPKMIVLQIQTLRGARVLDRNLTAQTTATSCHLSGHAGYPPICRMGLQKQGKKSSVLQPWSLQEIEMTYLYLIYLPIKEYS